MTDIIDMENGALNTEIKNCVQIIDDIKHIDLLEKSKVIEGTIDDQVHKCISEAQQDDNDDGTEDDNDDCTEDENENILTSGTRSETFYKDAKQYWKTVPATIDGMLGGFSQISFTDIRGSQDFLKDVYKMKPSPNKNVALDCGAGIGRVTKHLLIPIFNTVDIVEQDEHFASSVKEYVGVTSASKLGTIYNQGLQEFHPEPKRYDVIWSQWVLGHLTNDDFVKFFERCSQGLNKNGILIVKENVTSTDVVDIDTVDSSATRPLAMLKSLLVQSGFRIVKMTRQNNFPSGIFPVYMFALKPVKRNL